MDKEKEKPEDKRTSLTGGKMQKVESKSTEARQKRDRTQSMGWANTHILGDVHKSLQTLIHILHWCPYKNPRFPLLSAGINESIWQFSSFSCNFSLLREAPFKLPGNISVQAGCVHRRASKYNETLECRCNTRKWNIDFHLLFQTLSTLFKQKSKLKQRMPGQVLKTEMDYNYRGCRNVNSKIHIPDVTTMR